MEAQFLEETSALLNLIENHDHYDKIYVYANDPNEAKHQYLIKKHKEKGLEEHDDLNVFIPYSSNMQDVYQDTEEYNLDRKRKVLLVFDELIPYVISHQKKKNQILTVLFIGDRKRNIFNICIALSYFTVPKYDRLNCTIFLMKIPVIYSCFLN